MITFSFCRNSFLNRSLSALDGDSITFCFLVDEQDNPVEKNATLIIKLIQLTILIENLG